MPGPSASKPGDVIHAMNGTSIEIDNTDAEGRLVLADALWYATTGWEPECVVDVATLTGWVSFFNPIRYLLVCLIYALTDTDTDND